MKLAKDPRQELLPLIGAEDRKVQPPAESLAGFIDFLAATMPDGEIYLFGGVLRDLALYGKRGFDSDIDIVVEGDWSAFVAYLQSVGAARNKFGGYRLFAGEWPIDVWNAKDTWAIRQGLVRYDGISSLTKTTVLNWDAILMNWRTRSFVCAPSYLDELQQREIDVVLEQNPNPLGMAVRVFRHLSAKDARRVGKRAAEYLEHCAKEFSFEQLVAAEVRSYRSTVIEPALYRFFSLSAESCANSVEMRLSEAEMKLRLRGDGSSWRQLDLGLRRDVALEKTGSGSLIPFQ
ncbi:hypothetical protein [Thermomonas fusca]